MYNDPNQPPYGQPQPPYEQPPTNYGAPSPQPYGVPPLPPYAQPQQPYGAMDPYSQPDNAYNAYNGQPPQQPKSSLRWLWITLGVLGGLIALSCAGCILFTTISSGLFAQKVVPTVIATQYYQALQKQDYVKAHTYLSSDVTLTTAQRSTSLAGQTIFDIAAKTFDTQLGPISSFTVHADSTDTTHLRVTVTRGTQTYDVHLTLTQVGNDWKISNMDRL